MRVVRSAASGAIRSALPTAKWPRPGRAIYHGLPTRAAIALPHSGSFEEILARVGEELRERHYVVLKLAEQITPQALSSTAQAVWKAAGFNFGLGDYEGGSVQRSTVGEHKVYDVAAGAPSDRPVMPHNENAYLSHIPAFAAFGCIQPASVGGELTLVENKSTTEAMSSQLLDKIERLGVLYIRRLGHRGGPPWTYASGCWQDRFNTADWEEAKRIVAEDHLFGAGTGGCAELRWHKEYVELVWRMSGFALPPAPSCSAQPALSDEPQLVLSVLDCHQLTAKYSDGEVPPLHATWGDGSEMTVEELGGLQLAYGAARAVRLRMEAGDVVVVNNFRYAHGRDPWYGGCRQHLATFSDKTYRGIEVPSVALGV